MIQNNPPATLGGVITPDPSNVPFSVPMVNHSKVRTKPNVVGADPAATIAPAYIATANTRVRYFPIFMGNNPEYLLTLPPKPVLTELWR